MVLRTMCIDFSTADIEEKKIFIKSSCLLKHLTKAQNLGPYPQDGIQNLTQEQADSKNIVCFKTSAYFTFVYIKSTFVLVISSTITQKLLHGKILE